MLQADTVSNSEFVTKSARIASMLGVHLQVGTDFGLFQQLVSNNKNCTSTDPIFAHNHPDIPDEKGFWVTGYDKRGELVHTQAIRILDMTGVRLEEYLSTNLEIFRPRGLEIDVPKSQWRLSKSASQITGRVSYHGGLWLKGGPDGFRGGCLTAILTRYMLATCLLEWRPDFFIGFQAPSINCRGLGIREGYMRTEQRSILWKDSSERTTLEDWMVWMSCEEAEFNLAVPPELFQELFESNRDQKQPVKKALSKSA